MSYLFSYAQSDLENNNKPGISFDDDSKTRTENNFPAYSSNGKYIVLIHSDYSCCLGTPIEFHLIKIANQTIEKKIILSPGEDETPFSVEKIKQNIAEATKILNSQEFISMKKINSYTIIKNKLPLFSESNIQSLIIKENNKIFKSDLFQLPKVKVNPYCCGYEIDDGEKECFAGLEVKNIWINKKSTHLLIEHANSTQMNGCDRGPFYKIVSLHKSKN